MAENNYSIKDLETLSGIKAHTLRIWEQRYLILKPSRTDTNIRFYSNDDLRRVLNISLLNKNGNKISKISKLSDEQLFEEVNKITENNETNSYQIENLIISLIEMDEVRFEKIINATILKLGLVKTIEEVLYPFLQKIGVMWQTATINPAQEHFISNLIRQKIIVAIDSQPVKNEKHSKKMLLFLPESELHEISLLFYSYLIRSYGHRSIYLGQSVPANDMIKVVDIHNPEYLVTVITKVFKKTSLNDYLIKLSKTFPNQTLFVSGAQILNQSIPEIKNIQYFKTPQDFIKIVQNL